MLRERGHPLPKCWYRSIGSWLRYNFAAGSFYTMKLCSRLLMFFRWNFCEKNVKSGYLNPILVQLGVTCDLGWWLIGKPMVDFLFALIELYSLSVTVPYTRRNVYRSAVFVGGRSTSIFAAVKFYLDRVVPRNHSPHQKTRDTTQYWSVTVRQTDGRTDLP